MGIFDDLAKQAGILNPPDKVGYVWITMLIKFDLKGNASIEQAFVKHKTESEIKRNFNKKEKPKAPVPEEAEGRTRLF